MINRQKPMKVHTGAVLTALFLGVLGLWLWRDRGLAFSPGPLTGMQREGVVLQGFKAHADFEKQCSACHQPLQVSLGEMCLGCHVDTRSQIDSGTGIHGQIKQPGKCQACHSDHQGRDFDLTRAAIHFFDHSATQFSLAHHTSNYDSTPISCAACHVEKGYTTVEDTSCLKCHGEYAPGFMAVHLEGYGRNCLGCHDGADRMWNFAHAATGFTLEGGHGEATCSACHMSEEVSEVAVTCDGCHEEPGVHRRLFETSCENCHSAQGWRPARLNGEVFDHWTNAGFALDKHQVDYDGRVMTCSGCHTGQWDSFEQQTCISCHAQAAQEFMAAHQAQYGADCTSCHDGVDRMSGFEHATVFPLDGRHAAIACTDCHTDQVFQGTPTACYQCHAEPEIHAGVFGLSCEACHTTSAWAPARLLAHTFPLGHGLEDGQAPTSCLTCHPISYPEYICYGCHKHQEDEMVRKHLEEGISRAELTACVTCHLSGEEAEDD